MIVYMFYMGFIFLELVPRSELEWLPSCKKLFPLSELNQSEYLQNSHLPVSLSYSLKNIFNYYPAIFSWNLQTEILHTSYISPIPSEFPVNVIHRYLIVTVILCGIGRTYPPSLTWGLIFDSAAGWLQNKKVSKKYETSN
jgi:hypothetical protein